MKVLRPSLALRHWLCWGLIALLPWLSVSMAQRQTLGTLHSHASQAESAGVLRQALDWWMGQVRAQVHASRHARAHTEGASHSHDALQRHHHALGDASVVALESAADDSGGQAQGGVFGLLQLGGPCSVLCLPALMNSPSAWPTDAAARFRSRSTAPPRRPPRG